MDNADALPRQGRTGRVVPVSQFGKFPRLRARVAEQVRTRVDEAVRGVWRRFRCCLSCWIVVQSPRRFCKSRQNNMKKTVMYTLDTSPLLVEWVIESLFLICQLLL